jgi:hypothetical protein
MLVIDNDDPNYYSWKGALPAPNLTIINAVNLHSHLVYFLSEKVKFHDPRFKTLRQQMARQLDGEVDWKNAGRKFKSPFFIKGKRQWSYVKDGILQADFHYVLFHKATWTKTYSLSELEKRIKPANLDDIFSDEDVLSGEGITQTSKMYVHHPVKRIIEKKSGYEYMWSNGLPNAKRHYHPDLHEEMVKRLMREEFDKLAHGVKEYKIKEAVRCAYILAKKSWDPSKRRNPKRTYHGDEQSQVVTAAYYDHSSERQRDVVNIRHNRIRDIIGALNVDKYTGQGIPKSTFYYRQRKQEQGESQVNSNGNRWVGHGETLPEAAVRFKVSEKTIRRWLKEGKIEKIDGIHVLRSDLDILHQSDSDIVHEPSMSFQDTQSTNQYRYPPLTNKVVSNYDVDICIASGDVDISPNTSSKDNLNMNNTDIISRFNEIYGQTLPKANVFAAVPLKVKNDSYWPEHIEEELRKYEARKRQNA